MNLLVTGGAGFIGSHFVRAVLADRLPGLEGASITVLDKMTYAGNFANLGAVVENERLDFVPADTTDAPVVKAAFRGHDTVVHFSAVGAASDVAGIQVLLEAAHRHGVTRFLHVSAADVYGSIDTGAWTERSPLSPSTPRAAAKAGADLMALAFHRACGLPVVVTRGSETYGAYQHPSRTIPRLVTALLEGRTAVLHGGGTRVRDWLHVADHCQGLALALTDGRPGEIYHIAGSVELAERDLASLIRAELDLPPDRVALSVDHGDHRRALDDDKIRQELGWRPRVEFTTGLASTIVWYRDNPTWWRPLLSD